MSVKAGSSLFDGMEHALRLGVFFHQRDARRFASRRFEEAQRLVVHREEAAGRTIFRRHVPDRRAVFERHVGEPLAIEFDEFPDHALLAQHLRDGEHQIGRGAAGAKLAGEAHADDFGNQHGDGLAQHGRFRLDAADAPAEHGEPVDHRGVGVGADQRVGIGVFDRGLPLLDLVGPHRLRQIFEIDLMADAGARRHDAETVEALLAPAQEGIALAVALIFHGRVLLEGTLAAEEIDLHRMVDDEIDGRQRIDLLRIALQRRHRVAHRREIDHGRHAGEILHQHPRRPVGDFAVRGARLQPARDRFYVGGRDRAAVFVPQQILEQDLERIGQPRNAGKPVLLRRLEAEIGVGLGADAELAPGFETVEAGHAIPR